MGIFSRKRQVDNTFREPTGTRHPEGTRHDGNYPFATIPPVGVPGRSISDLTYEEKKAIAETELKIQQNGKTRNIPAQAELTSNRGRVR